MLALLGLILNFIKMHISMCRLLGYVGHHSGCSILSLIELRLIRWILFSKSHQKQLADLEVNIFIISPINASKN